MITVTKGQWFPLTIGNISYAGAAFDLQGATEVSASLVSTLGVRSALSFEITAYNELSAVSDGTLSAGKYAIEVSCKGADGKSYRMKSPGAVIEVSSSTTPSTGTTSVRVAGDEWELTADVEMHEGQARTYMSLLEEARQAAMDAKDNVDSATAKANDALALANEAKATADEQAKTLTDTNAAIENAEAKRVAAEQSRVSAEDARADAEATRATAEENRADAEATRATAEEKRADAEIARQTSETARAKAAADRDKAEQGRKDAENGRSTAETARVDAEEKREAFINSAKTTIEEASKVDAQLDGTKISVTNRKGETKSLELVDIDEHVTVAVTSDIDRKVVPGLKVSVYRNHGETPEIYTTDNRGIVTFNVTRGTYYEVHLPDKSDAQSISPIGYTATLPVRNIDIAYLPASDGPQEHVVVSTKKVHTDGTWEAFPKITFTLQIADGAVQNLSTGEDGTCQFDIPMGKKYKVVFPQQDGFYNPSGIERNYTAYSSNKDLQFPYYTYKFGVFVVAQDGQEYTLDQFKEQGIDKSTAKMVAVYERNLVLNGGVIYASIDDLSNQSFPNIPWCSDWVLFNDIPKDGSVPTSKYYYNGNEATKVIIKEAAEKGLVSAAANYAQGKAIVIGDKTMTGYLPSVGQMNVLNNNRAAVDDILKYVVGDSTKTMTDYFSIEKWTSAQNGVSFAYVFGSSLDGSTHMTQGAYSALFFAY